MKLAPLSSFARPNDNAALVTAQHTQCCRQLGDRYDDKTLLANGQECLIIMYNHRNRIWGNREQILVYSGREESKCMRTKGNITR